MKTAAPNSSRFTFVDSTRFIVLAWHLRGDARLAMPSFRYSIIDLAALFAILLMDHDA